MTAQHRAIIVFVAGRHAALQPPAPAPRTAKLEIG
jgi:hypothetical protein